MFTAMSNSQLDKAREEVTEEYEEFRRQYGRVLEAVQRVSDAGPLDDIHGLLHRLEETVHDVRTGGAIGSGAKGHREALEKLHKLEAQPG
jgi:hypothetical protein